MRLIILAWLLIALAGCSREPTLTMADLNGVYSSPPCPEFTIKDGQISDGQQTHKFGLTNIKGDNLIVTSMTIFFAQNGENCRLLFRPSARYLPVKQSGGIEIELSSDNFQFSRRFTKKP